MKSAYILSQKFMIYLTQYRITENARISINRNRVLIDIPSLTKLIWYSTNNTFVFLELTSNLVMRIQRNFRWITFTINVELYEERRRVRKKFSARALELRIFSSYFILPHNLWVVLDQQTGYYLVGNLILYNFCFEKFRLWSPSDEKTHQNVKKTRNASKFRLISVL